MRFSSPLGALLSVGLVVPAVVLAPTVAGNHSAPHAVSPVVQQLALRGVDRTALQSSVAPRTTTRALMSSREISRQTAAKAAADLRPVVLTEPTDTDPFRVIGVTWQEAAKTNVIVTARTRTEGRWTSWFDLEPLEDTADDPSPSGQLATSPYWAGSSDGVQVRVDAVGGSDPAQLEVNLIEPGTSPTDAAITDPTSAGAAFASTDNTNIVTRAEWGADESLRDKHLDMSDTVKVAFVHHSAGSNNYGPNEGPAVVRGLYSYYVNTLGYADIGYNFLVDRYGNVYEGRAGSITKSVRQAATGGFNTDTMAIAALGNFVNAPAPDAMVHAIARILAFRLSAYHRDPLGRQRLRAADGSSRYSAGETARFKVIAGHRDAGFTACPGGKLYKRLPDIRRQTKNLMGSNLVEPSVSTHLVRSGHPIDVLVHSRVLQRQRWTLTVRRYCDGTLVRQLSGRARPSNPIDATWHGRNRAGQLVAPGRYRLTLTSSGGGSQSVPWQTSVAVRVGSAAGATSGKTMNGASAGAYVPLRPKVIADTRTGAGVERPVVLGPGSRIDVPVLGRDGVPSSGVSAVAVSVLATCASANTTISVGPGRLNVAGARVLSVDRGGTARGFTLMRVHDGMLTFRNSNGVVALNVSVAGYVSTTGRGGSMTPVRRTTLRSTNPLTVDKQAVNVAVAGRAGVPGDARAVVLNMRRSRASNAGAVWAWPAGSDRPGPTTWRRQPGTVSAGRVVVPIGAGGQIRLRSDHRGAIALDVVGYVAAGSDRPVRPVVPQRITKGGLRLHQGKTINVSVRGRAGVPTSARAALVQLSGMHPRGESRITIWPRGNPRPKQADLLVPNNRDRDEFVLVPIGKRGDVRVHAGSATAGVRVVVLGWVG